MKNKNNKFNILDRVNEEIRETAAEIYSGLDPEEQANEAEELAEDHGEEITERVCQLIENMVIYYYDSAQIVLEFGYFNGWDELQILGGEAPNNISQLAYAVIYEELTEEGILYNYEEVFHNLKEALKTTK